MSHEKLAETVLLSPAFNRLHTIFRHDRLSIVPSKAVAQSKHVFHAIRRHSRPVDHLGFNLKVLVRPEEGIIDKIAVVAREVGSRPDGVEDLQTSLRDKSERPAIVLGVNRRGAQHRSRGRSHATHGLSATDAGPHGLLLAFAEPAL